MKIFAYSDVNKVGLLRMLNKLLIICCFILPTQSLGIADIEEIPADEKNAIQEIVSMIEQSVRAEAKNAPARRDAHSKAHGCVMAKFSVLPSLPHNLKTGIFKKSGDYPAWIRFSNGSGRIQNDSEGDGRGMAIKLMAVENSKTGTQDFVMINHPVFFVRNAADYVEFQKVVSVENPTKFFFPSLNPFKFRLHEFWIVNEIKRKEVSNPLDIQYWSMTPYSFGQSAMKFSVRSCNPTSDFPKSPSPNFLRENMTQYLQKSDGCFDFMVQIRTHIPDMPIEDPTVDWKEEISPFIPVARITIPRQEFNSPEQTEFCENLSFTPWHAIPEHRPLGGINRVRKAVYETISRVRHEINGRNETEPTKF